MLIEDKLAGFDIAINIDNSVIPYIKHIYTKLLIELYEIQNNIVHIRTSCLIRIENNLLQIFEDLEEDLYQDQKRLKEMLYKLKKTSKYEAIEIFRKELYSTCLTKINNNEDSDHFGELLTRMKNKPDFDIERIKEIKISETLDHLGVPHAKTRCRCPLCGGKNFSKFHIKGTKFKCYGCEEWGNSIDLVMKYKGYNFIEACKLLKYLI